MFLDVMIEHIRYFTNYLPVKILFKNLWNNPQSM